MRAFWLLAIIILLVLPAAAQTFELAPVSEVYRASIGETLRAPIKIKNTSDKPSVFVVRRLRAQLGSSQKSFFCIDNNCSDQKIEELAFRLDPGQTLTSLSVVVEAGLAHGISSLKLLIYNKANPSDEQEIDLNIVIEEASPKGNVFQNSEVVLHEVYPNPVTDHAFIDYQVTSDATEAKIVIHNLLGNPVEEIYLPAGGSKAKIRVENLSAGVYFYTLYVNNEAVLSRKFVVKK